MTTNRETTGTATADQSPVQLIEGEWISLSQFLDICWQELRVRDEDPYQKIRDRVEARARYAMNRKKTLPVAMKGRYPKKEFVSWVKKEWPGKLVTFVAANRPPPRHYAMTGRTTVRFVPQATTSMLPAGERVPLLAAENTRLDAENMRLINEISHLTRELEMSRADAELTTHRREMNRASARRPRRPRG